MFIPASGIEVSRPQVSTSGSKVSASRPQVSEVRLMVHMGMRTKEPNFCLEAFARRDGYVHPDNRGYLPDRKDYEQGGYFYGLPEQLRPDLDIKTAGKAAKEVFPVSSEPSHYFWLLCHFPG